MKVKFTATAKSLPYSTRFETMQGTEHFQVIHDKQVKVCCLCIQPGHIIRDCPEFTCHKCGEQGHYARECNNEGRCMICKEMVLGPAWGPGPLEAQLSTATGVSPTKSGIPRPGLAEGEVEARRLEGESLDLEVPGGVLVERDPGVLRGLEVMPEREPGADVARRGGEVLTKDCGWTSQIENVSSEEKMELTRDTLKRRMENGGKKENKKK